MNTQFKKNAFTKLFPPPAFLRMPAVGLDISSQSVRVVEFLPTPKGIALGRHTERKIPVGSAYADDLMTNAELRKVFEGLKKDLNLQNVSVSLPEDRAFLFNITVPNSTPEEIRTAIELQLEENVPISAIEATFDYEVITEKPDTLDVSVAVFPRKMIDAFSEFLTSVGLTPVSFHLGAAAVARAVVKEGDKGAYIIANFGERNTGIYVVSDEVVQFTSNLNFGNEVLTGAIAKHFSVTQEEAAVIKRDHARMKTKDAMQVFFSVMNPISALRDEINRVSIYWLTHKGVKEKSGKKIEKIILCGSDASLPGMDEYLTVTLKMPVELANVWVNAFSFDEVIPEIPLNESLNYAAAIGLAINCCR